MSDHYHLVDIESGQLQSASDVGQLLDECLAPAQEVVEKNWLSENNQKKVAKVTKVVEGMKETVQWVWSLIEMTLKALALPPQLTHDLKEYLFAALYLEEVARKTKGAQKKKHLKELAAQKRKLLFDGPFAQLEPSLQAQLEQTLRQCVGWFSAFFLSSRGEERISENEIQPSSWI